LASRPSSGTSLASRAAATDAAVSLHGAPPTHLTFAALVAAGLPHASTTRHCPTTPAAAPPLSMEARTTLGDGSARVAFARQVHGAAVVRATAGGLLGDADVIVTTAPGQPIAVVTADCLPIVLCDPARAALAIAHVGWRGTVKRTARAAVEALVALGAEPARMIAAIGPSIGPCCYEVDRVVIDPLAAAFPSIEPWVAAKGEGKWMLDLWAANEAQLTVGGVDPANIYNARLCTACRADLFHSYRKGSRGRLTTLAMLAAPAR
jgi:YfiH family protein